MYYTHVVCVFTCRRSRVLHIEIEIPVENEMSALHRLSRGKVYVFK